MCGGSQPCWVENDFNSNWEAQCADQRPRSSESMNYYGHNLRRTEKNLQEVQGAYRRLLQSIVARCFGPLVQIFWSILSDFPIKQVEYLLWSSPALLDDIVLGLWLGRLCADRADSCSEWGLLARDVIFALVGLLLSPRTNKAFSLGGIATWVSLFQGTFGCQVFTNFWELLLAILWPVMFVLLGCETNLEPELARYGASFHCGRWSPTFLLLASCDCWTCLRWLKQPKAANVEALSGWR